MKKIESKMCLHDEAFTKKEMKGETNRCRTCGLDCPNAKHKEK